MKTILLFILIFFYSLPSHSALTVSRSTWDNLTGTTCTDFQSCIALFGPMSDRVLTGTFDINSRDRLYAYYHAPESTIIQSKYLEFDLTDDCYIGSDYGIKCGLLCNSRTSCLTYAGTQCTDGYVAEYDFIDVANWTSQCADIRFEDDHELLPDEAIIYSTIQGERGLRGQKGEDGIDGIDGIDGQSCTVQDTDEGLRMTCGEEIADLTNGIDGKDFEFEDFTTEQLDSFKGEAGIDGIDGFNGRDGIDGQDAVECTVDKSNSVVTISCPSGNQTISELAIKQSVNADLRAENCFITSVDEVNNTTIYSCPDGERTVQVNDGKDFKYEDFTIPQLASLKGEDGQDGINGTDGEAGKDGQDGTNGTDGIDGIDGEDGLAGLAGKAGTDGVDGENVDTDAVVSAINNLNTSLTGTSNNANVGNSSELTSYDALFTDSSDYETSIETVKAEIKAQQQLFFTEIKSKFTFDAISGAGYTPKQLDLGKWGSHDISISRFSDYFGGIGNVIYFLAALTALTIVLGGIKL
jgi:hypothetical protein